MWPKNPTEVGKISLGQAFHPQNLWNFFMLDNPANLKTEKVAMFWLPWWISNVEAAVRLTHVNIFIHYELSALILGLILIPLGLYLALH